MCLSLLHHRNLDSSLFYFAPFLELEVFHSGFGGELDGGPGCVAGAEAEAAVSPRSGEYL